MRKIFLAGITAVSILAMGTTALAAETAIPRRSRAHGSCHQQLDSLWLKDRIRHDCAYVDADGDGICDSCSWYEDRHHSLDENGYCLNGACSYENCGYAHGTGYCRGYCNSVAADAGTWGSWDAPYQETAPVNEASAGGGVEDTSQNSAAVQNVGNGSNPGSGNESGGGYGSDGGYRGSGCHGGGHHGGRHGCH